MNRITQLKLFVNKGGGATYSRWEAPPKPCLIDRLVGLVDRLLARRDLYVCSRRPEDFVDYEEVEIDTAKILDVIRDQLSWAYRTSYKPTKIIVGPEEFLAIKREADPWAFDFRAVNVPAGVPLLHGLELVVNPCIKGAVLG